VRTKGPILATLAAVVLAAACSSGNSGPGPAILVEKSAAISQGDAICKQMIIDVQETIAAFKTSHPTLKDAEVRDFLVNTLLPRIDNGVGDLHRIGEPTKDRVGFDDAIRSLDKDLSAVKQAVGSDPVKVLTAKFVIFNKSAKLFTDYGFKECGKA
jgi:hypothetical protein